MRDRERIITERLKAQDEKQVQQNMHSVLTGPNGPLAMAHGLPMLRHAYCCLAFTRPLVLSAYDWNSVARYRDAARVEHLP